MNRNGSAPAGARSPGPRAWLLFLTTALLIVLVVLASRPVGDLSTDAGVNEDAGARITDAAAVLLIGTSIVGAALFAALLRSSRRRKKAEDEFEPYVEPEKIHWAVKAALIVVPLLLLAGMLYALYQYREPVSPAVPLPALPGTGPVSTSSPGVSSVSQAPATDSAQRNWVAIAAAALLILLASAVTAWVVTSRRRNSSWGADSVEPDQANIAYELSIAANEALAFVEEESDARVAVIAAYARMESIMAEHGLARRPAETPEEYAARVLRETDLGQDAVVGLTSLFELARFSNHAISGTMRDQAIAALQAIRTEM